MKEQGGVQRRELCILTGMTVGFRVFFAVFVDGKGLMNSGWIALMIGLVLAVPAAIFLIPMRRFQPSVSSMEAILQIGGKWSLKLLGVILFAVLTYDGAVSLRMLTGMVRYVAMPEGNKTGIMVVTAATVSLAAVRGPSAAAGAAVTWRRAAAIFMGLIIALQFTQMHISWITPVLGPGIESILDGSLPAAGILSFVLVGWLMLSEEKDSSGTAIIWTLLRTGVISAAILAFFCMLTPVMPDEPLGRSFRLGRLLANDRAGLSLEMLYVLLIYGGMLTTLLFEAVAAVFSLGLFWSGIGKKFGVFLTVGIVLGLALLGTAEREVAEKAATWYYPLTAFPFIALGTTALFKKWKKKRKERNRT